MEKNIKTLTIYYDAEIKLSEISLFRGAVLHFLGEQADPLYHNHIGDNSFRYAYPLIQYKRIHRRAAIVCIGRGIDNIGQLLSQTTESMTLGNHLLEMKICQILPATTCIMFLKEPMCYHIQNWLPFNTKNYQQSQQIETPDEHKAFLENILKANILSMLKGLDIHVDETLNVSITSISEPTILHFKGIGLTSFNADFSCNLSLPDHIGIGKNASIGFGIIHHIPSKNK